MKPWGFQGKHFHVVSVFCVWEHRACGAGSGAGSRQHAAAARTVLSSVQNMEEDWEQALFRKIGLDFHFLVLYQWEICKKKYMVSQNPAGVFLIQRPKPAWEKHLGSRVSTARADRVWPVFTSWTDPFEGIKQVLLCVRGCSTHSSLHRANSHFLGWGSAARWDPLAGKVSHLNCRAAEFLCPHPPRQKSLSSISMLPLLPLRWDLFLQLNSKCFINSSSVCKWTLKIDYFFVCFS